jgi:hypothetical protein
MASHKSGDVTVKILRALLSANVTVINSQCFPVDL